MFLDFDGVLAPIVERPKDAYPPAGTRAEPDRPVARFGRKVLEVLPPVGSNKGTAVRSLLEGRSITRVLVAGDDTTDLDAFRAVEEYEDKLRVAVLAPESPRLLAEHAELVLGSTG